MFRAQRDARNRDAERSSAARAAADPLAESAPDFRACCQTRHSCVRAWIRSCVRCVRAPSPPPLVGWPPGKILVPRRLCRAGSTVSPALTKLGTSDAGAMRDATRARRSNPKAPRRFDHRRSRRCVTPYVFQLVLAWSRRARRTEWRPPGDADTGYSKDEFTAADQKSPDPRCCAVRSQV